MRPIVRRRSLPQVALAGPDALAVAQLTDSVLSLVRSHHDFLRVVDQCRALARSSRAFGADGGVAETASLLAFVSALRDVLAAGEPPDA